MKKILLPLAALSLSLLLAGCNPAKSGEAGMKEARTEEKTITVDEALKQLPCFNCHKTADYNNKFPHQKHMALNVHCNQCHNIEGHRKPFIALDACASCHNVQSFTYPAQGLTVSFNHRAHAARFNCSQCHPAPFRMKQGATAINMAMINKGQSCGACHNGQTAFSAQDCARCHK